MVNAELQVIEVNLDIVMHRDGTLISPMTTPMGPAAPPEETKVGKISFSLHCRNFQGPGVTQTKCVDEI